MLLFLRHLLEGVLAPDGQASCLGARCQHLSVYLIDGGDFDAGDVAGGLEMPLSSPTMMSTPDFLLVLAASHLALSCADLLLLRAFEVGFQADVGE